MLLIVDTDLNIYVYDQTKLKHEVSSHNQQFMNHRDLSLVKLNLIKDCRYFEHSMTKQEEGNSMLNEPE
jgi:hypothetical protein